MGKIFLYTLIMLGSMSCTSYLAKVPDQIGGRGLLVGQLYHPGGELYSLYVDGKVYDVSVKRDGYFVLPLSPGKHELTAFVWSGSNSDLAQIPVKQSFTVEKGKAVSVGKVIAGKSFPEKRVVVSYRQGATLRYIAEVPHNLFYINNAEDMKNYLAAVFPEVYSSLVEKKIIASTDVDFIDDNSLLKLREYYLSRSLEANPNKLFYGYVGSELGSMAQNVQDANGKHKEPRLYDLPTIKDMRYCSSRFDRVACMTGDFNYVLIDKGKMYQGKLGARFPVNGIFASKGKELIAVDNAMNIFSSLDNGKSWRVNTQFAVKEALEADQDRPYPLNSFVFVVGQEGYYIYGVDEAIKEPRLIYADYGKANYRAVILPPEVKKLYSVKERNNGLYVGPFNSDEKEAVYFRPDSGGGWEKYRIDGSNCSGLVFNETNSRNVQVLCNTSVAFKSLDGGRSWEWGSLKDSIFGKMRFDDIPTLIYAP